MSCRLIKRGHPLYLPLLRLRLIAGHANEFSLSVTRSLGAYSYTRSVQSVTGGIRYLRFRKGPNPFLYRAVRKKGQYWYLPDRTRLAFLSNIWFPRVSFRELNQVLPMYKGQPISIYFGKEEIVIQSEFDVEIPDTILVLKAYVKKMERTDRRYNKISRKSVYATKQMPLLRGEPE